VAQALADYTFVKKWADQSDKLAGLLLPKNGYEYTITPNVAEPTTTIRVTKANISDPTNPLVIGHATINNYDLALSHPEQVVNTIAEIVMQIVNNWEKHLAIMNAPKLPDSAFQVLQQQTSLAQQLSGAYSGLLGGSAALSAIGAGIVDNSLSTLVDTSSIAGFDNGIQSKYSSPLNVNTSKLLADQLDKDKKEMDKAIAENAPNAKYLVEQYWMKLKSFQATQEKEKLASEEKQKLEYIKKYGGVIQNTGTITKNDGTVLTVAGIKQAVQSLQGKSVMPLEPKYILVPPNFEGIEDADWGDGPSAAQLKALKPEAAKYVKDRGDFGSQAGQRFIMKLGAMGNMHVTFRGKIAYSPSKRTTYTFFCDQCPDTKLDVTTPIAVAQLEEFDATGEDVVRFCTYHQHLVAAAPSGEGRKFREAD